MCRLPRWAAGPGACAGTVHLIHRHLRRVPRSTAPQVQACGARASWCAIAHKHYVRRGAAVLRRRFCGNIPLARWGTATRRRSRCAMSCAMRTSQQRHQDKLHPFCQQQHSAAAGGSLCRASSRAPDGRLGRGAGLFGVSGRGSGDVSTRCVRASTATHGDAGATCLHIAKGGALLY